MAVHVGLYMYATADLLVHRGMYATATCTACMIRVCMYHR